MGKSKDYPLNDTKGLKQVIKTLKSSVKERDAKIKRLLSEVKTLKAALNESVVYVNHELADIPVETIVSYFKDKNSGKDLSQLKDIHKNSIDSLRSRWECFKCDSGYLRLMVLTRRDGKKYFRVCSNCNSRTKMKKWHCDVEGLE